jgi:hypothetical protein
MVEGDEVFELGLDDFAVPLALVGDGIVAHVALAVDLEGECVTG